MACLLAGASLTASAAVGIDYDAALTGEAGGNAFAPFYMMSNNGGRLTSASGVMLDVQAHHRLDRSRRFSYAFGIEALAGWQSAVDYERFTPMEDGSGVFGMISRNPSAIWLQQLYGQLKYRQVFLQAGMRQDTPRNINPRLSSGDLVRGVNARPIPGVWIGFIDFVDIPFTRGWVQIEGQVGYGKFTDKGWLENHFNYYTGHINTGSWYTYKRCYFRTKPSQPFSVTVGMQTAGVFGGTTSHYEQGRLVRSVKNSSSIKTFFNMFLPRAGTGEGYYVGNSLGCWDIFLRYRLNDGSQVRAYHQRPFETGSGIGFLNGFDGLWGIEFNPSGALTLGGWIRGAVVEYIDTYNQSGPNHYDPADNPGTDFPSHTSGGDEYYNNQFYNSYANYGMSIGTPMLPGPIYNRDGFLGFTVNRLRGFHIAVEGDVSPAVSYRLMGGYRKGYGTINQPLTHTVDDASVMAEVDWRVHSVPGLALKGRVGFDAGSMLGDRFGVSVGVTYSGLFNIGKK